MGLGGGIVERACLNKIDHFLHSLIQFALNTCWPEAKSLISNSYTRLGVLTGVKVAPNKEMDPANSPLCVDEVR